MQRILIYLGHPAHFYLFKNVIRRFKEDNRVVNVLIVIKSKDILEHLLDSEGLEYKNILVEGKKSGKLGLAWSLVKRDFRMGKIVKNFQPDMMLGTSAEIAHIGSLFNIPSYVFEEDDWDVVPAFAKMVYPFAYRLVAPTGCRMGKWEEKTIRYSSYHELAYLHPDHFEPSKEMIRSFHTTYEPYFILRFVELAAHHDDGIAGINNKKANQLISFLSTQGKVYITSERELSKELEPFRISIDPIHIHHALYYADLYIGDSQTMAAESMVLGTPSIRFNDFVGRISYLEELENYYGLGYGFKTDNFDELYKKVEELSGEVRLKEKWENKRSNMLSDKINFSDFIMRELIGW